MAYVKTRGVKTLNQVLLSYSLSNVHTTHIKYLCLNHGTMSVNFINIHVYAQTNVSACFCINLFIEARN